MEGCRYDKATGQLLTGSMLDYAMPRADDVPSFKVGTKETPCTHNPLGVKGCGEAGAIGSPAALINAITDALGVKDMRDAGDAASACGAAIQQQQTEERRLRRTNMYAFDYQKVKSVADAAAALAQEPGREAPRRRPEPVAAMKLRLAQPRPGRRPRRDRRAEGHQGEREHGDDRRDDAPRRGRRRRPR